MPCIPVAYGRAVEHGLAVAADRRCAGDVDQRPDLRVRQPFQSGDRDRGTEHAVRAVRLHHDAHLRRASDARTHLIADDAGQQGLGAARTGFLRHRQGRGQAVDAGMAV